MWLDHHLIWLFLRPHPHLAPHNPEPAYANEIEDEHALIAQFCQNLSKAELPPTVEATPKSGEFAPKSGEFAPKSGEFAPSDNENEQQEQQELENIINDLEEENMFLMEEYSRLQSQLGTSGSTPGRAGTLRAG